MATITTEVLHLRALRAVRTAGRRGLIVEIGSETRSQQELVEEGHLWQEVAPGHRYKFTLSPSGQRILDQADGIA